MTDEQQAFPIAIGEAAAPDPAVRPRPTAVSASEVEAAVSIRVIETPVGAMQAVASATGLRRLCWPEAGERFVESEIGGSGAAAVLDATERQLGEYFEGARRTFDLSVELAGTDFQVSVWQALVDVGFAATSTYGAQAASIGRPTAVRAVGSTNGRNPVAVVVPCHRIIGSNGALTGYAGGLDAKRFLLTHEAEVAARG